MVKHGRNKKRRAGRIGRTTLKNRSYKRWNPDLKISNATVRECWDKSKSPQENLRNMGVLAMPNTDTRGVATAPQTGAKMIELFDVPDSDEIQKNKKKRNPLNADEQNYIAKCLQEYGDDYKKMFRDTRLNEMQHTEQKLRKMGSRFLLLTPDQRFVDVPENVQHLVG